jgi:hypothetical protein
MIILQDHKTEHLPTVTSIMPSSGNIAVMVSSSFVSDGL